MSQTPTCLPHRGRANDRPRCRGAPHPPVVGGHSVLRERGAGAGGPGRRHKGALWQGTASPFLHPHPGSGQSERWTHGWRRGRYRQKALVSGMDEEKAGLDFKTYLPSLPELSQHLGELLPAARFHLGWEAKRRSERPPSCREAARSHLHTNSEQQQSNIK